MTQRQWPRHIRRALSASLLMQIGRLSGRAHRSVQRLSRLAEGLDRRESGCPARYNRHALGYQYAGCPPCLVGAAFEQPKQRPTVHRAVVQQALPSPKFMCMRPQASRVQAGADLIHQQHRLRACGMQKEQSRCTGRKLHQTACWIQCLRALAAWSPLLCINKIGVSAASLTAQHLRRCGALALPAGPG